ncbi:MULTISPECIES: anthranilate synthase component II [Microbacterium]|uniref:Aminodeoxychorismate/anthranilate synthase component II n=1 Tax=Microbacterium wangchenii TaxID=2541726 RepID=A0ABX5SPN1_9MICO|nr:MULTISPECIES: gamma-glutamyl-gamma-aminobutyrate hydrolase family protein [Microbacterium]MCK6066259.1 gamma-glutamyl-gamma-aminobutyrate hydrolase family protein [Microbacterium sp. EYE_512]QBR87235.1 aminodeoxychorismate/anthranilate synthase component II [Microbacterium wangchenii]TFV84663.1 aminodeoxychorismate/anthranilate synthase component II [Microbacterium sp. dk485]TXK14555.1 aminodeoxychorismate/anthranilate synthase component II [Microbacterium wangchenii]
MSGFRVVVVDNHDSFVHTLAGYIRQLGADVELIEADAVDPHDAASVVSHADAVLVSPGPGDPEHAGASIDIVRAAAERDVPLLGVCLGHQAIGVAFGATVGHAPELMHGLTSLVEHDATGLFRGLARPMVATRYHSLTIVPESLPPELAVTAVTESGVIMGVAHRSAPIQGVQFHPESILTEGGHRLLGNWLASAGLAEAEERGRRLHPRGAVTAPCTP